MSATTDMEKPFFDSAFWTAVPSLAWVALIAILVWYFNEELKALSSALVNRLKSGGQVKLGGFEIGAASGLVAAPGDFSSEDSRIGVFLDAEGSRARERDAIYENAKSVVLVHRLQRSAKDGQLYDILIYVIPHKGASLAGVTRVEYFFGHYWGNKIYPSTDRGRGFPIVTSAFGPFLCTAKVIFNDSTSTTLSRYIDFEMGGLTSPPMRTA